MFLVVVSVMAGILFREIVDPTSTSMNFSDFYVSYLAMYQVCARSKHVGRSREGMHFNLIFCTLGSSFPERTGQIFCIM